MKAKYFQNLENSLHDESLDWIIKGIARAILSQSQIAYEIKFNWKTWDSIPHVKLNELGYSVGLDHPMEPKKIIFRWY